MIQPLKEQYTKEVVPALKEKFGYTNAHMIPKINKVTISIGAGQALKDKQLMETYENTLVRITGQQPVKTKAKKSISNFKIREGNEVGIMVTLRGQRMYDFISKLIHVSLPRIRDFRGISPKGMDRQGNYTLGIKEHVAFPEINPDEIERVHGLQITIATSAKNKEEGFELLKLLGFPFTDK